MVRAGNNSLSKILTAGHRSEMGLYESPWSADFPGVVVEPDEEPSTEGVVEPILENIIETVLEKSA